MAGSRSIRAVDETGYAMMAEEYNPQRMTKLILRSRTSFEIWLESFMLCRSLCFDSEFDVYR